MTKNVLHRPFYHAFAWAYDLIIAGPVQKRCAFWQDAVRRQGVLPGSRVLDAGCGTGSYAIELAQRGYIVTGMDASRELVSIAKGKVQSTSLDVTFQVGDLLELPAEPQYDGILCRGVLNDMLDDTSRQGVFLAFARALRDGGVLILDVREWQAGKRLTVRIVGTNLPYKTADIPFTLRPGDGGTVVTLSPDYELKFGVLGKLFDRLYVRRAYLNGMQELLAGLKRFVETGEQS